jgi:2-oxoglutarate dehydrogenase E2 component (dihydrolipoamide succinyltransferase)
MHDDQPQKQDILPMPEKATATQSRFENSAGSQSVSDSSSSSNQFSGGSVSSSSKPTSTGSRFYSPLVLNIAQSENVSMSELETIPGSGNDGRVTKKDILQYVEDRSNASGRPQGNVPAQQSNAQADTTSRDLQKAAQQPERKEESSLPTQYGGNVEIIEMDRMRKMISKHMTDSKHTSAHVTSFSEADVTNMVLWRDRIKKEFEKRENEKITFTPLFIEAIVKCIKKYPWLNSSVDGDKIIIRKDINIGMATALPTGNLIVPVIKNADQLNLVGLTKKVNGMANAARNNKLRPDDTAGGTFTMTNVGSFGSIMGTPIINQPQVAILAVGAIKKKPVVIETEQGDSIAIRHMMYLSMSYDHRIIDGALGSTFLNAVAKELENFNPNREI